jgi:membrane-associated phospholipid phosphatase
VKRDLAQTVPRVVLEVSWLVASQAGQRALAPAVCRWCAPNGMDAGVRDGLRLGGGGGAAAATVSDVLLYATLGGAPLLVDLPMRLRESKGGCGRGRAALDWGADAAILAESMLLTASVTNAFKLLAARQRPYCLDPNGGPSGKCSDPADTDRYLSFFSGHTSTLFAGAVSFGMLASMRRSPNAPYVWAAGLALAATTGYLRIAADKHWLSDVLFGALWGTALGVAVPLLHGAHLPSFGVWAAPVPGGALAGVTRAL